VTVNMFETVFDEITWDIHGSKPFSPISCYPRSGGGLCLTTHLVSLLEDLQDRRLLDKNHGGRHGRIRTKPPRSTRPAAAITGRSAGPS